jgi:hypothetical protein
MHPDLVNDLKSQDSTFYRFFGPSLVAVGIFGTVGAAYFW